MQRSKSSGRRCRSNSNIPIATTTTTAAATSSNPSSSCFKFHNFVFNEDSHSFCLEEQHGNKKITVLHWKKSDNESSGGGGLRVKTSDSDSLLLKSAKTCTIPSLLAETEGSLKRKNHTGDGGGGVAASASFPSTFAPETSGVTLNVAATASHPSCSEPPAWQLLPQQQQQQLLNSTEELASKSANSSSSVVNTSSSSSLYNHPHSAFCLNRSLHDLNLAANLYRTTVIPNRRKPRRVRRILTMDDDSDESDLDDWNETREAEMEEKPAQFKPVTSLFNDDEVQTQPLDLSTKSKPNIDSDFKYRFRSSEHRIGEQPQIDPFNRLESLSPSALISSIKCCSPPLSSSSHTSSAEQPPPPSVNRFLHPALGNANSTSLPDISSDQHQQQLSPDIFDSFLEEEICRFLQTTQQRPAKPKATREEEPPLEPQSDIDKRIEQKLWLLRQEILNQKSASTSESFLDAEQPSSASDHIKLHFKLDSNKNLEPYDIAKHRASGLFSQTPMLARSRFNQRTQIKRQLEDAFKQNGFLVKVFREYTLGNVANLIPPPTHRRNK